VKVKLFTVNFLGGAKLFTVGCGEWFLRLSLPPMNNFGGTIRKRKRRGGRIMAGQDEQDEQDSCWAASQVFKASLFDACGVGQAHDKILRR
jgi:hypothetical protein